MQKKLAVYNLDKWNKYVNRKYIVNYWTYNTIDKLKAIIKLTITGIIIFEMMWCEE